MFFFISVKLASCPVRYIECAMLVSFAFDARRVQAAARPHEQSTVVPSPFITPCFE